MYMSEDGEYIDGVKQHCAWCGAPIRRKHRIGTEYCTNKCAKVGLKWESDSDDLAWQDEQADNE